MLRSVVALYAVLSFVCVLCGTVLPQKSRQTFRFISAAVILAAVLPAFANLKLSDFTSLTDGIPSVSEQSEDALRHTANLAEKKIYAEVQEILMKEGVDEYEIEADILTDEAGGTVTLSELHVLVDERFRSKIPDVKEALRQEFGDLPQVGVKQDETGS